MCDKENNLYRSPCHTCIHVHTMNHSESFACSFMEIGP